MGIWGWLADNSFNLLSAGGIIGGLLFSGHALRSETKTRRVANLLTITANHREIWKEFAHNPALARVLDAAASPSKLPITNVEAIFVNMVIFHISGAYYAMRDELVINMEGLRRDVSDFFSLPIPRAIWERNKVTQNDDFVAFVESCRNWK
jgi:hypothetical protein